MTLPSNASATPEPISFADMALSPRGACQLGADALAAGRPDIAERLVFALRSAMLPHPEKNPWDGPAGAFWSAAFRLDPKEWLEISIGQLPKEEAKLGARALLMESARLSAFKSFEYLLSLGAVRRTWKLLEAAYLTGGSGAARLVKKPTPLEAAQLLYPHYRPVPVPLADLLWCADFLAPDYRADPQWLARLARSASDELAAECVPFGDRLKLDITPATAPALCARLAAQNSGAAAAALMAQMGVSPTQPIGPLELTVAPERHSSHLSVKTPSITLCEAALLGCCSEFAADLLRLGASVPTEARLRSLLLDQAAHWNKAGFLSVFEKANAIREALELQSTLDSASPARSPRARGL